MDAEEENADGIFTYYRYNEKEAGTTAYRLKPLAEKLMKTLCLNLQGLDKYHEEAYDEALVFFKEAVSKDRENINALRHCRVLYRKINMSEQADEMSQQIAGLSTGEGSQVFVARSMAEVALASLLHPRLAAGRPASYRMLGEAIQTAGSRKAGNSIREDEIALWKLAMVKAMKYIPSEEIESGSERERYSIYAELASGDFAEVTAYALTQLAMFLQRPKGPDQIQWIEESMREHQVLGGSPKPKHLMKKAYDLDPTSLSLRIDYLSCLTKNKNFPEAQRLAEEMARLLAINGEYAIEAHIARGEFFLELYKYEESSDREQLKQAIEDFRQAAKRKMSPSTLSKLGTAYHLLSMHDKQTSINNRTEGYFEKAIEILGGDPYSLVHFHHSVSLFDFGLACKIVTCSQPGVKQRSHLIRRAVESSKRAIEDDDLRVVSTFFMFQLMKQLLTLYAEEKQSDFLLSELTFWMLELCEKYGHVEKHIPGTLKGLYDMDKSAINRTYHNLISLGHSDVAELFPMYITNFLAQCPDNDNYRIGYLPPPKRRDTHNWLGKEYDVLILSTEDDRLWVYYSLLTKLEGIHEMKCCLEGRDDITTADDSSLPSHLQKAATKSVCILLVITRDTLQNSIFFNDGQPSPFLKRLMEADQKIMVLNLYLKVEEAFSHAAVEVFDASVVVPWESLVRYLKISCGDTENDLAQKFDVEADLRDENQLL